MGAEVQSSRPWGAWAQWATLAICVLILVAVIWPSGKRSSQSERIEDRIALASAMLNRGLPQEAVAEYLEALELARGDKARQANLCYLIGKTYFDSLKDYEKALAYFARAEHFGLQGPQRGQMEQWIVESLERTGRSLDARNRVKRATALRPEDLPATSTVVARVGDRPITMAELDSEIRTLPAEVQKQMSDPKQKAEFLEEYVTRRLLAAAAERANLNRDPKVLTEMERARNSILIGAYLESEIMSGVAVTSEEINLYYEGHKKEFLEPRRFELSHIELANEAAATSTAAALSAGEAFAALAQKMSFNEKTRSQGGRLGAWVEGQPLPEALGDGPEMRKAVADLRKGRRTEPLRAASGRYHIVQADEVSTPTARALEQVRDTIAARLRQEKSRKRYQEVLDRLRKAENVVIYRDAIEGAKVSP